jgi:uncharacterized protein (TIGR02722 family)
VYFQGCGASRTVNRISADSQTDISGKWNDTDARLVAEQMIHGLTGSAWLSEYAQNNDKKPTVIVGTIRNLSSEHIETEIVVKDIERELINSGKIKFVASKQERDEVRQERLDQQSNASEETAKRLAEEQGADFLLRGSIKDIVDKLEGKKVTYYQVDLELINVETNEKVWLDTKKIKKVIEQSGTSW